MRNVILGVFIAACLSGPVRAQDGPITGVIGAQIEAFQADDFARAFEFASPLIQGLFGTPENFGRMVRQGYPMVWRPAEVTYLEQRTSGPFTYQKVLIKDAAGALHVLEYEMIETGDGWQINGVQFLADPPLAT